MNFTLKLRWRILLGFIILFIESYNASAKIDPELKFIENKNQWPSGINFGAQIPGGKMFVQPGRFSYFLKDQKMLEDIHERTHKRLNESDGSLFFDLNIKNHFVQVNFKGANLNSIPTPFGKLNTYYNYYLGNDPSGWASEASSYSGIYYKQFYKGIDLKIYSVGENLKYDYIVAPYADPSQIIVEYEGADNIFLDNGNLMIKTSLGDLIEKKPYAFQFINGKKMEVKCEYLLHEGIVTFSFPEGFDPCYELTIDPLLIFSTFSGSTADNWGSTATPGEKGTLYSAGVTNEESDGGKFPATPGAFQTTYGGQYDIGILKYDSLGETLLYATYLGGHESESPHSLIMNADEELIVLGTTSSSSFPTTVGAIDRSFEGGDAVSHVLNFDHGSDLFVARINKDGTALLSSTFLGGDENDGLNSGALVKNYGDELRGDIITDADRNVYISTVTASDNFPVTKGFDTLYNNGTTDALLIKLNQNLSKIIWATFIGGNGTDAAHTLKLDNDRNIFIAGGTNSTNFPKKIGSYQSAIKGLEDGWIAKIKNTGDEILNITFTGTDQFDQIYFLDIDNIGGVYVYGQTAGDFPITPGTYNKPNSGQFVQKFNTDLTTLEFSTVFGSGNGKPDISPTAFMINECNNLYMCGWGGEVNDGYWNTRTNDMQTSDDAFQKTTSGSDFYFIVLTADASQFLYGSYMGGTKSRTHVDGGTSRFSKDGIVYHAVCAGCKAFNAAGKATSDFPTTAGAWSNSNNSKNCNNAAFKFDLSSLKAHLQTNSVKFDMPGLDRICIPDLIAVENNCIGGKEFVWHIEGIDTDFKINTPDSAIFLQFETTGDYKITLTAIDKSTCIGEDSVSTIIHVYEKKTTIQDDDALCFGTPYTIKAQGDAFYDWTTKDGSFEAHDRLNNHTVSPVDTTMYYVTISEEGGCIRKDSVQLNVIPSVDVDFKWNRITDCFSRPRLEVNNTTKLWDTDIAVFDFGDGHTSDVDHIIYDYEKDNKYHVKLTVAREFCTFEKSLDFNAYVIKSPNVITPGTKDGSNDFFTIQYGETPGKTPKDFGINVSVLIYNRWGKLVYESDDYNNEWSGEGLASGVYFYEVKIDGEAFCKDWIHLVK